MVLLDQNVLIRGHSSKLLSLKREINGVPLYVKEQFLNLVEQTLVFIVNIN